MKTFILFLLFSIVSQYPRRQLNSNKHKHKHPHSHRLKKHRKSRHKAKHSDKTNKLSIEEQAEQNQCSQYKKLKKKSDCDLEKESICGSQSGIISLKNVRDDSDCYLVLNYCKTSEDCKFQSITINQKGDLVKKLEDAEISDKKCEWINQNEDNAALFVKVKAKLFDEPLIISFMKLVKDKNFNNIMAKLDDIGSGGSMAGPSPVWINDRMTIQSEDIGPPEDENSMGPLERSQAEQRKNQYKTPIGIISRRSQSNPHYQKFIYQDKRLAKYKSKQY